MDEVKRYEWWNWSKDGMQGPFPRGDYMVDTDVAPIIAERDRLEKENDRIKAKLNEWYNAYLCELNIKEHLSEKVDEWKAREEKAEALAHEILGREHAVCSERDAAVARAEKAEEKLREARKAMLMSVSEKCKKYLLQDCDNCLRECGDNTNPVIRERDRLRELLAAAIKYPWEGPYEEKQELLKKIDAELARKGKE